MCSDWRLIASTYSPVASILYLLSPSSTSPSHACASPSRTDRFGLHVDRHGVEGLQRLGELAARVRRDLVGVEPAKVPLEQRGSTSPTPVPLIAPSNWSKSVDRNSSTSIWIAGLIGAPSKSRNIVEARARSMPAATRGGRQTAAAAGAAAGGWARPAPAAPRAPCRRAAAASAALRIPARTLRDQKELLCERVA